MERIFSTIVFIFNKEATESLFLNHKKLGKWLPPGGKVDPNEIPEDAAVREVFEETGIKVKLVGERAPIDGGLIRPYGMQLNTIVPGVREHIDFIYLAVAQDDMKIKTNMAEASEVRWMKIDEILAPDFNTFSDVGYWIKKLAPQVSQLV